MATSSAFKIPTIFEVIDRATAPIRNIQKTVGGFTKQMFSFASAASIAGSVIGGIAFTGAQIVAFDKAERSFRTIVSDLSDADFSKFRAQIFAVANATRKSSTEVAQNFEVIAGLNSEYAKTADGLAAVSEASIILAKASNSELAPAAESLVSIMNQYAAKAQDANRFINVLAAGQAVGAASINDLSEAFTNAGSTLKGANESIEGATALLEVLAGKGLKGAEAGTKLRGSILKLQQSGAGYASGQFKVVDALEQVEKKFKSLRTAKAQDAYLNKLFGAENVSTGRILLNNIALYKEYTQSVTGTSEAQKAAEINSGSLSNKLAELKNRWVTLITGSDESNKSLDSVKNTISYVTDNMETLISVALTATGVFVAYKLTIAAASVVMAAYNVIQGLTIALQGKSAFFVQGNTIAYGAYRVAVVAATAAQTIYSTVLGILTGKITAAYAAQQIWNVVMMANPIGLVIAAILILINIIASLIRNWDMVKKSFMDGGIVGAIKAIGKVLLDAVLWPLQKILEISAHLPGKLGDWSAQGAASIEQFRKSLDLNVGNTTAPVLNTKTAQNDALAQQMMSFSKGGGGIDITVKDESGRANVSTTGNLPQPKLTPTLGQHTRSK